MLTLKIQSNALFSRLKLEKRETIKSKKRKKWKPETEENIRKFFLKLIFLKYPQNFRKTHWKIPMLKPLLIKVGLKTCNFIKKRIQHRCFPVNDTTFSRTPFLREQFRWLLLSK